MNMKCHHKKTKKNKHLSLGIKSAYACSMYQCRLYEYSLTANHLTIPHHLTIHINKLVTLETMSFKASKEELQKIDKNK